MARDEVIRRDETPWSHEASGFKLVWHVFSHNARWFVICSRSYAAVTAHQVRKSTKSQLLALSALSALSAFSRPWLPDMGLPSLEAIRPFRSRRGSLARPSVWVCVRGSEACEDM